MIRAASFNKHIKGKNVRLFTLENKQSVKAYFTNFGATIVGLKFPDRKGVFKDVILGFDSIEGYLADRAFHGVIAGRYANRIANAEFKLDGQPYRLTANDGKNTLHGGSTGFGKRVWDVNIHNNGLEFSLLSEHGDEGFPGNLNVTVTYQLSEQNEIIIDYRATTDVATVLNLTNHAYFNLAGHDTGAMIDQELSINADYITEKNAEGIPTGKLLPVHNSPFDFKSAKPIGRDFGASHPQMNFGTGYDHNFVVEGKKGELNFVAKALDPESGRMLEIFSTLPGVQLYTGDYLIDGPLAKDGHVYQPWDGFCLESQFFPDSPNHDNFPTTTLLPGETYVHTTIYKFLVKG